MISQKDSEALRETATNIEDFYGKLVTQYTGTNVTEVAKDDADRLRRIADRLEANGN